MTMTRLVLFLFVNLIILSLVSSLLQDMLGSLLIEQDQFETDFLIILKTEDHSVLETKVWKMPKKF